MPSNTKEARKQRDLRSVKALRELLERVVADPASHLANAELHKAIRSQGALAKYSTIDGRVHAMSLNHQKAIAAEAFGGFDYIDKLRRSALDALAHARATRAQPKGSKKKDLEGRIRALESELQTLLEDLFVLQRAFDTRCGQARVYAAAAGQRLVSLCAKEQKELEATFSLMRHQSRLNVTPIGVGVDAKRC